MARQYESKYKFTYRRTNKLTPDTIKKLEEAAGARLSDKSSCSYAGISRDTFYRWLKQVPGLADRLDDLKENPIIRAKRRIVSQIDNDTNVAFRYLEKEDPEEYGEKLKLEHSGEVKNIPITDETDMGRKEDRTIYEDYLKQLRQARERRVLEENKKKGEQKKE